MGVGAMVSVLALGDGVEKYARDQIEKTSDLLTVVISPRSSEQVDGMFIPRETVHVSRWTMWRICAAPCRTPRRCTSARVAGRLSARVRTPPRVASNCAVSRRRVMPTACLHLRPAAGLCAHR